MSLNQLIITMVVLSFLLAMARYAGWTTAFISAYILTLGGITTNLYQLPGPELHFGIGAGAPTVQLGDVLLVGILITLWKRGGRLDIGWIIAIFSLPAVTLILTEWGNTPQQWAGFKIYATAIIAFGIGRWISEHRTDRSDLSLAIACLLACAGQFLATFAQSRGIALPGLAQRNASEWLSEDRMVGLFNHPGFVGKAMFLLFCFLLPLSASGQPTTRKLAYIAIGLGSVATLLTLSRANSFAIGVAILIWVIFSGRATSVATRLGTLFVAAVLLALNSDALVGIRERQLIDPNGGYRRQLLQVGLEQIRTAPWTGVGPNSYSDVVGQHNELAARGFPVHNSFLLTIAELGIPLAVILFTPILITVGRSVRAFTRRGALDVYSTSLLAVTPGVLVATMTGWGMMSSIALPLWFMGFGFLAARHPYVRSHQLPVSREASESESSQARDRSGVLGVST